MRKLSALLTAFLLAASTTACGTYIEPGHVGIVIDNTGGGVQQSVLREGWHGRTPFATTIVEYPTFMQTLVLTRSKEEGKETDESINVTTSEAQPINLDVSLSFEVTAQKAPNLYKTFRTDVPTLAHGFVRQTVRSAMQDVVSLATTADVMGPKKEQLRAEAEKLLTQKLAPYGIDVKQFTINEVRPPQAMVAAIQAKNQMEQEALRVKNKLQAQQYAAQGDSIEAAGAAKAVVEQATAEAKAISLKAEANERMSKSISPALIQYEYAKRWNGALPVNMYGGGAVPFINVKP